MVMLCLAISLCASDSDFYRFSYELRGDAETRILFIFPLKVYFESVMTVTLQADSINDREQSFRLTQIPEPAYILRTLGFGGKEAVLLFAAASNERNDRFFKEKTEEWNRRAPRYAERVKKMHRYQYRITGIEPGALRFIRSVEGFHHDIHYSLGLDSMFSHQHSIYFKILPMMQLLLSFYDHSYLPPGGLNHISEGGWSSEPLDFSEKLNAAGALMEKAVEDLVTIRQKRPLKLYFKEIMGNPDQLVIEGNAEDRAGLWKGFFIQDCRRLIRLRRRDFRLLEDMLYLNIRDEKGRGGYGKMDLKIIR